jgi:hypothetical protein
LGARHESELTESRKKIVLRNVAAAIDYRALNYWDLDRKLFG